MQLPNQGVILPYQGVILPYKGLILPYKGLILQYEGVILPYAEGVILPIVMSSTNGKSEYSHVIFVYQLENYRNGKLSVFARVIFLTIDLVL